MDTYYCHRNRRVLLVGDRSYVHHWVLVFKRVVAEMVPERTFGPSLTRDSVSLDNEVTIRWNP